MLGQLVAAGASLLGGLLGGDEESKTRQKTKTKSTSRSRTSTRMGQMVRMAERNGFNPLTVLRAGGLAAFSNTSSSSFSNSKMRGSGSSSSSSPLGAGIAAAGQAIGGAFDNEPSAQAINSAAAWQAGAGASASNANQSEYDALQSQLKAVQPGALGTQPRVPVASVEKVAQPQLMSAGAVNGIAAQKPEVERGKIINPLPGGILIPDDIHSADDWESLLSEPGGWIGGLNNAYRIAEFNDWGVPQFKKDIAGMGADIKAKVSVPIKASDYMNVEAQKRADQIASQPINPNIWDPWGIKVSLPPVVETKPKPDLYKDPFPAWGW